MAKRVRIDPDYIKLLTARINESARKLVADCRTAGIIRYNQDAAPDVNPSQLSRWLQGYDSLYTCGRVMETLGNKISAHK